MANFVKNMDDFGIVKYFTIESTDWNTTNKTYTIEDNLITVGENESAQFISYNPALYDDARYEELCKAAIRINSVSNGQIVLKCTGILPTSTQYLMVTFKATYSPSIFTIDGAPIDGSQNPISSDGVYEALENKFRNISINKDSNPGLVMNSTYYDTTNSGNNLYLTYNTALHMINIRFWFNVKTSLNSGTDYTIATIPSSVIDAIGHHYSWGTAHNNNGNTTIGVLLNTWDTNNVIQIQPRANVSSGNYLVGNVTYFV